MSKSTKSVSKAERNGARTSSTSREAANESAGAEDTSAVSAPALADADHPEYEDGLVDERSAEELGLDSYTPSPDGPWAPPGLPLPGRPLDRLPIPLEPPFKPKLPVLPPLRICTAVSGRYRTKSSVIGPLPIGHAGFLPLGSVRYTVRVDVDRFHPQERISIEAKRIFPASAAHAIAVVTNDACVGFNHRRIEARIDYRDGDAALIPGDTLLFEAKRTKGKSYGAYSLTLTTASGVKRRHELEYVSKYFDTFEYEVDCTDDATNVLTTYDTSSHPNRPASLPLETLTIDKVFERAGFDTSRSPNTSVVPAAGAGANSTWSDLEMHDAMQVYWSRFANKPQWAMWVFFARQHDMGRGLGGIMFDDIGPNHRQGTAIFTESFIQDVPAGDAAPSAFRRRSTFWTAVHEMGHGFNLAHSWQKALGNPWIPIADEPEARSFMNYPYRVAGGPSAFYSDFAFRFSDQELLFMRHAPRRFVQMGNEDWFENHGFEEPPRDAAAPLRLEIRPNRSGARFAFMEPVTLELKLTNTSGRTLRIDEDLLADGRHVAVLVRRAGGAAKRWRPFVSRCHEVHEHGLAAGDSIYGSHFIGASTSGFLVDEPGAYEVQAAVDVDGLIVLSNVFRLHVGLPTSHDEHVLASAWFTEDVARALAFQGAPSLVAANDTLREVVKRCSGSPAAVHAALALSTPRLRDTKILEVGADRTLGLRVEKARIDEAAATQRSELVDHADAAAETLGHITYFETLDRLATALAEAGHTKGAVDVQTKSIATMQRRGVLTSVVDEAKERLAELKS